MPVFDYSGYDISKKLRTGQIEAKDEKEALKRLRVQAITDVELELGVAPAPPMSDKKRALIGLGTILLAIGLVTILSRLAFGPPNMTDRMLLQDAAINDKKHELRYADYFDPFFVVSKRGGRKEVSRGKAQRSLLDKNVNKGKTKVYNRKSQILEEKWVASDYHVTVEHKLYAGDRTNLGVAKTVKTTTYVWKREMFEWKIHEVRAH